MKWRLAAGGFNKPGTIMAKSSIFEAIENKARHHQWRRQLSSAGVKCVAKHTASAWRLSVEEKQTVIS
jgi:hypothetical protein